MTSRKFQFDSLLLVALSCVSIASAALRTLRAVGKIRNSIARDLSKSSGSTELERETQEALVTA
jgi:hypothetical protein